MEVLQHQLMPGLLALRFAPSREDPEKAAQPRPAKLARAEIANAKHGQSAP